MNNFFKSRTGLTRLIIVLCILLTAIVIAAILWLSPKEKEPIKIGAILSISGPAAATGQANLDGMQLAVDEINKWGGINKRKLKLIIEDNQSDPKQGIKAFKKIEQAHHPLLYISNLSIVSMALAPLALENNVVITGFAVTAQKFTRQNKWVFRYWPPAKTEIEPILFILRKLDIKNLGIFYVNDDFGQSVNELLKKSFELPGRMVTSIAFDPKGADMKQQMEKLNNIQGIYIVGFPFHTMNAIKLIRQIGFKGFILTTQTGALPEITNLPQANNVYLAAPVIYNPNFVFAKEAKEKYEARFSRPFSHFAAVGYDFMKILASLLEDRTISRWNVKTLLEKGFIYPGVFGDICIKAQDQDIIYPLHPAQIIDGRLKYLR